MEIRMKEKHTSHNNSKKERTHEIPDLDIIDLESDDTESAFHAPGKEAALPAVPQEQKGNRKSGIFSHINIHIILLAVVVIFIIGIIYKFKTWGVFVDLEEIFKDGPGEYDDTFDVILPLTDATGHPVYPDYGGETSILMFGNAPLADDRDSKDNLANMIQEMTGATVYNCSVSGSYLAALSPALNTEEYPMDIFNFYWLLFLAMDDRLDNAFRSGMEALGTDAPPEAMDVYNTLKSIDLNTVDVITVMYDASDYLAGHGMYSDENATDIMQFTGNLEAGIELIQQNYPNIRIIVLSPAYAYGIDENGEYVSSDIQRYGWDVLSTYVIKQYASCASRSVTFVDNLYGTINEDNADKYLVDHLHLNVAGRKKVAERFVYALNYFQNEGPPVPRKNHDRSHSRLSLQTVPSHNLPASPEVLYPREECCNDSLPPVQGGPAFPGQSLPHPSRRRWADNNSICLRLRPFRKACM